MQEFVDFFMDFFRSAERNHGYYLVQPSAEELKKTGKAWTTAGPATAKDWFGHLKGDTQGLGVAPILNNNTCWWGLIDIDQYEGLDLRVLAQQIARLNLPLVVCRSKSGGAHICVFFSEPVKAKLVRDRLREIKALLGFPGEGIEIFPKQTELLPDGKDLASWVNMPYYDADKTTRYGFNHDGNSMDMLAFAQFCETKRITAKQFKELEIGDENSFPDGPPCLQQLQRLGFPFHFNDAMVNIAIYLKKSSPENWPKELEVINKSVAQPLSATQVADIVKSLKKKDYNYMCHKSPIKEHCNLLLCKKRRYGVGTGASAPCISLLEKQMTTPPLWFAELEDGGKLQNLATKQLQSQLDFQLVCMEQINKAPEPMKQSDWVRMLNSLLKKVTVIPVVEEATETGSIIEGIFDFCCGKATAETVDQILQHKAWTNGVGWHCFQIHDLRMHMERLKIKFTLPLLVSVLRRQLMGETYQQRILGRACRLWKVKPFSEQTEPFAPPKIHEPAY